MSSVVTAIIIVTVSSFLGLLMWVAQRGKPTVDPDTGDLLFRHSAVLRGFALFSAFGIPLAITILVIFNPPKKEGDVTAIFGLYALFAVLSAPILWESMRFSLLLTDDGIACQSPWRGSHFIPWEEVEEITFSSSNSMFIIHAEDGYKFRVLTFVPGLMQFLAKCEEHLPIAALNPARDGYNRYGRPFPRKEDRP